MLKLYFTIVIDDSLKGGNFNIRERKSHLKKERKKMREAQREPKEHFRILFINDAEESKKAVGLLKKNNFSFSHTPVDPGSKEFTPDKLPLLITDEGQWQGLGAIERYIRNSIALGEPL